MTDQSIIMSNLSYKGEFLRAWDFVGNDTWRLYYKKYQCHDSCAKDCGSQHGFQFAVIFWVSSSAETEDFWANDTEVEFLFNGTAYFDGVRHMYLGTENNNPPGYIYYPKMEELIEMLSAIKKLEIEFCDTDKL